MNKRFVALRVAVAIALIFIVGYATPAAEPGGVAGPIGVSVPQKLMVPPMGFDDVSITVIWSKPADYTAVAAYNVYQDKVLVATTTNLFYNATKLIPGKTYAFSVSAKMKDSTESAKSNTVSQATPVMKILNVESFGAKGDGASLDTAAIQATINACPEGGKVLIPAGKVFVSGAVFLKSNMTLQIDGTLRGSDNPADYPKTNWRFPYYSTGANYAGLINVYPMASMNPCAEADMSASNPSHKSLYGSLTNVRICGSGTVNGSSTPLDTVRDHGLTKLGGAQAAGKDSDRADMIAIKGVTGVYLGGLFLHNPPAHTIFVSYCKNVTVNGINASTYDIHNADGIDLCTTDTAYIFNSVWDTGDDCINFNAGQGKPGVEDNVPDTNIRVFNCTAKRGHGGVVFGSFTAAWIQNVLIEDCVFDGTEIGFRFKTGNNNGGGARFVTGRDCIVRNITKESGIFLDSTYNASGYGAASAGQFRDITFTNISCYSMKKFGIYVNGLAASQHSNLSFSNITVENGYVGGVYLNHCAAASFDKVVVTGTSSGQTWRINGETTSDIKVTNSTP